jgi:hypothetical protein
MGVIVTTLVGLALAGAATFGLVQASNDAPGGTQSPSAGVTYDSGN